MDTWYNDVQTRSHAYRSFEFGDAPRHREAIRSLFMIGGVIAALAVVVCLVAFVGDPPPDTFLNATSFP